VSATVESGENLRTHPTLTRTAAGFAVTGTPIGAAWWKKTGSVFLLLEGPDWAELVELKTKQAYEAQKLAQQVNLAARLAAAASGAGGPSSSVDAEGAHTTPDPSALLDHLERLAKLRQQGALTDEEFEAQKRRLLQAA
jgi:hypothetical protein